MSSNPAAPGLFEDLCKKFVGEKESEPLKQLEQEIEKLHEDKPINDTVYSMFTGILNSRGKMVREITVLGTDAFMVDINDNFQDNLDDILHEPYPRIPVYDQDEDIIVGVIHIRTVLRKARKLGFDKLDYQDVMYKPLSTPETIDLGKLLAEMQKRQQQTIILTDEYGRVAGLATIEDLIEETVGNIDDGVGTAEALSTKLSDNEYAIYGKTTPDDFNEEFETSLEMEDVDAVVGYVITKLGMIPAKGEKLSVPLDNGMVLTTRGMKGSRIPTSLLIILSKKEEEIEG